MIGVVARAEERDIVREFFELFKTPWEFCRDDERYRVLVHADGASRSGVPQPVHARLKRRKHTVLEFLRKRAAPKVNCVRRGAGEAGPVAGA